MARREERSRPVWTPVDQTRWVTSVKLRTECQRLSDEIGTAIDPRELANKLAVEIKFAVEYQSKERTVASYIEKASERSEFTRQCFVIAIASESIFNQIFNGRSGYRAMYLQSAEIGEEYNSYLIKVIREHLIRDANTEASLNGTSVKIWPFFETRLLRGALEVPEWRDSPMGQSVFDPRYPILTVKGAFLNSELQEFDPKPHRAVELQRTGYT
jgi:hypothetical protein